MKSRLHRANLRMLSFRTCAVILACRATRFGFVHCGEQGDAVLGLFDHLVGEREHRNARRSQCLPERPMFRLAGHIHRNHGFQETGESFRQPSMPHDTVVPVTRFPRLTLRVPPHLHLQSHPSRPSGVVPASESATSFRICVPSVRRLDSLQSSSFPLQNPQRRGVLDIQ
jgi:hypothetical protein